MESKNDLGIQTYRWLHQKPSSGIQYYRIKQLDLDGRYSYSDVVSAKVESAQTFSVYPNPATQVIYIDSQSKEDFKIQIFDSSGNKVLEADSNMNAIDISTLNVGLFHLIVNYENSWYNTNFIKSK